MNYYLFWVGFPEVLGRLGHNLPSCVNLTIQCSVLATSDAGNFRVIPGGAGGRGGVVKCWDQTQDLAHGRCPSSPLSYLLPHRLCINEINFSNLVL